MTCKMLLSNWQNLNYNYTIMESNIEYIGVCVEIVRSRVCVRECVCAGVKRVSLGVSE